MFCTNCGNYNSDEAKVCTACGTPMVREPQPASYNYQQPNYQPYNPQQNYNQMPYGQPYAPQMNYPPTQFPGKAAGVVSLVFGILSLVFFWSIFFGIIFSCAGIISGCIFNVKAKQVGAKRGLGVAGIICSVIGLLISVLLVVAIVCAVTMM